MSPSHFTRFAKGRQGWWADHRLCDCRSRGPCLAETGPLFWYSDSWQLLINTGTTIITFLMVFLIQNTQNRDAEAVQVKLDELLRATAGAHNALLDLEELEEEELDDIRAGYARLAKRARASLRQGEGDTGVPEVNATEDAIT